MSGICALVNLDGAAVDAAVFHRMMSAGEHRGPDGSRQLVEGATAFGFLALHSTPEAGLDNQPLRNREQDLWLTADARLDNRAELTRTLGLPRECTDSELVLASYLRWEEECPNRLRGDFAFALWDNRRRRLFCATDAFGVKPLHYARKDHLVCVASEAQQILRHPQFPLRLDEWGVGDFLTNNCQFPERTLFADIHRLTGAHSVTITSEALRLRRYWEVDPEHRLQFSHPEEYVEQFQEKFERAVKARLRTQGTRVGVLVSGGLDSGAVAAMGHRLLEDTAGGQSIKGYSYSFQRLQACDERQFSSALTDELGIPVDYVEAEQFSALDSGNSQPASLEHPITYTHNLLSEMISRMRSDGARVMLTGHGGDGLLQGSGLLYLDRLRAGDFQVFRDLRIHAERKGLNYWHLLYVYLIRPLLPRPVLSGVRRLAGRSPELPSWINPEFARRTGLIERMHHSTVQRKYESLAKQEQYESVTSVGLQMRSVYLLDRLAHRAGVEARHPFLDRDLTEYILAIPAEQVFQPGASKYILRVALDGLLPDRICWRWGKTRFDAHFRYSFVEADRMFVRHMLENPLVERMAFCSGAELTKAYERYVAGTGSPTDGMRLLFPISLERWLRQYGKLL